MKSDVAKMEVPTTELTERGGEIRETEVSPEQQAETVLKLAEGEMKKFTQTGLPQIEALAQKYDDRDADQETKGSLDNLAERARQAYENLKIKILVWRASSTDFDLKKIPEELHPQVCSGLIEKGRAIIVVHNLDKFVGLDKKIVNLLIEKGHIRDVIYNLDKFAGLDNETANLLIEKGQTEAVVKNLDKFAGLDKKMAALLIEKGHTKILIQNLDKFAISNKEMVKLLIEKGQTMDVVKNIDNFTGLDKEIANLLIENNLSSSVILNLDKFTGLDKEIANLLITENKERIIIYNLDKFAGLDNETANLLIEKGQTEAVVKNLDKFAGLDKKMAALLIEKGQTEAVVKNLDKFVGLDHKEIVTSMIENGQARTVAHNLDKFVGLDREMANLFIEKGQAWSVAQNLDKFVGLDHKEIANLMIEKYQAEAVVQNLDKFVGLDHKEIVISMIENGRAGTVAIYLDKFVGLDGEMANLFIEKGQAWSVAQNLDKFVGLDHKEIANLMIEKYQAEAVVQNLDKFVGLDHKEIVISMIENGRAGTVAIYLDKFAMPDKEVTNILIEKGNVKTIIDYIEQFKWIIADLVTEKKLQKNTPEEICVLLGQTMSDRFLYSFEEESEKAIQQQKKNREAVLNLFDGMSKDRQQVLLPNLIEHALDPDFGDIKVAKSLIEKIDDPNQRAELQKITPENIDDVEDKIKKFQQKLEKLSNSNRESTLAGMIKTHGQEKVEETMQEIEKGIFFTLNLSLDAIDRVIEEGRLKSSWETKTRNSSSYTGKRDRVERNLGIRSKGTEKDPHPIYGAMGYRNGQDELQGVAPSYGECFIKLKNEKVQKRGAFTYGDSFRGEVTSRQFCFKDVAVARAKVALDKTENYVELQMLKGITLDDVESFNIPKQFEVEYTTKVKELQEKIPHIPINFV